MTDIPDIASAPDNSLHSTLHVAAFLGRTPRAIRHLVNEGHLVPVDKKCSLYFTAAEIKRYLSKARLFKSGLGIPCLQKKGQTDEPAEG